MINLPKPSPLSAKGNSDEKINYIINYLQQLTSETENILCGIKTAKSEKTVADVTLFNNSFVIIYSDGTTKALSLTQK